MRLLVVTLVFAAACGWLLGGRLSHLRSLHLRWAGLAFAGVLLQLVPLPPSMAGLGIPLLLISYVPVAAFAWVNRRLPGFVLILVGMALNFAVIAANNGMPVSERALAASGQSGSLHELVTEAGAKHHLATGDDTLLALGDVISLGPVVEQVASVGDIVAYGGLFVLIATGMQYPARHAERRQRSGRRRGPLAIGTNPSIP